MATSNRELVKAKYIMALAKNDVTDDIRQAYAESLVPLDTDTIDYIANAYAGLFESISVLMENGMDIDDIKDLFKNEFIGLGMETYMGTWTEFEEFSNFLLNLLNSQPIADPGNRVEMLKSLKAVNAHGNALIQNGIDCAILNLLVRNGDTLIDMEFSQQIIDSVDKINVTSSIVSMHHSIEFVIVRRTIR